MLKTVFFIFDFDENASYSKPFQIIFEFLNISYNHTLSVNWQLSILAVKKGITEFSRYSLKCNPLKTMEKLLTSTEFSVRALITSVVKLSWKDMTGMNWTNSCSVGSPTREDPWGFFAFRKIISLRLMQELGLKMMTAVHAQNKKNKTLSSLGPSSFLPFVFRWD